MVSCVRSSAVSNNWIPNFIEGVNEFLSNSSVNEFLPNSRFLNCHSKNGVNEFLPNSRYSSCRSKNENKKKRHQGSGFAHARSSPCQMSLTVQPKTFLKICAFFLYDLLPKWVLKF
tara:strand:+ start:40 stop:387 length:348 start_codon:yes stop_codon:yes gene_type:complete